MANGTNGIESRLWSAADELRANSKLKAGDYSGPVLGLIFLKFADHRFTKVQKEIEGQGAGRRQIGKIDYQARGILYLPDESRFSKLIALPAGEDIGKAVNEAMKAIEAENDELRDVLPKTYHHLENQTLSTLLKTFNSIPMDVEGDMFGKIYEYFLGKFAMSEGSKGGEFFTPTSIVKLIVDIIEPFKGRILDPACGSGGMFIQSAKFIGEHNRNASSDLSIFGQERVDDTVRLCRMNLAVHGLAGDIRQGNSYYENPHKAVNYFDFVMANPPFNVNGVDKERIKDDPRFKFGLPSVDNGNYLWIEIFHAALKETGRAGFVMANSASDARGSEMEIRKKLIQDCSVDVMVAIGSNFFYTVTLPVTLWFLDKGKRTSANKDKVLFIDARHIYRQIDRAHRDLTPAQHEFLSNIVRLYRGEDAENLHGCLDGPVELVDGKADSAKTFSELFPDGYQDIPGLCKVADIADIEEQGWSLNPGRYVGVAEREEDDFDFYERLEELQEELEVLNSEAHELEDKIAGNVASILNAQGGTE